MKIFRIAFLSLVMCCSSAMAQTAKQVLDKASATVSYSGGVSAHFSMSGSNGNASGSIAVKGKKFHASTSLASVWFDGKTQWTYMKKNNEVNVNNPSGTSLQALNPYNFVNLYKSGYSYQMKKAGNKYEVHLTATNKSKNIKEMYITVNSSNYVPTQVRMKQSKGWSTINISNFKKGNLSDNTFRFNAKEFPSAEVIDLR